MYTISMGVFQPERIQCLATEAEQIQAEQEWLDANHGTPGCVNLSMVAYTGWPVGSKHSAETIARLRVKSAQFIAATIRRNQERVWTPEQRTQHSAVHMGIGHSEETRRKMSQTRKSRPDLVEKARQAADTNRVKKGQKKSEEAVAKIRVAALKRRGIPQDPEVVSKRAAANRGRKNTPETIQRMSEAAKRRPPNLHGQSTRDLISSQQKGRIWITDGHTNLRLSPDDAQLLLDAGWVRGRSTKQ